MVGYCYGGANPELPVTLEDFGYNFQENDEFSVKNFGPEVLKHYNQHSVFSIPEVKDTTFLYIKKKEAPENLPSVLLEGDLFQEFGRSNLLDTGRLFKFCRNIAQGYQESTQYWPWFYKYFYTILTKEGKTFTSAQLKMFLTKHLYGKLKAVLGILKTAPNYKKVFYLSKRFYKSRVDVALFLYANKYTTEKIIDAYYYTFLRGVTYKKCLIDFYYDSALKDFYRKFGARKTSYVIEVAYYLKNTVPTQDILSLVPQSRFLDLDPRILACYVSRKIPIPIKSKQKVFPHPRFARVMSKKKLGASLKKTKNLELFLTVEELKPKFNEYFETSVSNGGNGEIRYGVPGFHLLRVQSLEKWSKFFPYQRLFDYKGIAGNLEGYNIFTSFGRVMLRAYTANPKLFTKLYSKAISTPNFKVKDLLAITEIKLLAKFEPGSLESDFILKHYDKILRGDTVQDHLGNKVVLDAFLDEIAGNVAENLAVRATIRNIYERRLERVLKHEVPFSQFVHPLKGISELDGWKVIHLKTPERIFYEGVTQKHCVGNYVRRVKEGSYAVYHIEKDEKVGTLGLMKTTTNNWLYDQCYGPHNSKLEIDDLVTELTKHLAIYNFVEVTGDSDCSIAYAR